MKVNSRIKPIAIKKLEKDDPKSKDLDISNCNIDELPKSVLRYTKLKTLNLFSNNLTELPSFFSELDKLQNVVLSKNRFKIFPSELAGMSQLKMINLQGNQISYVKDIERLSQSVEKIDLSNNNLSVLRTSFSNLSNLKTLKLDYNEISKFPKSIIETNLRELTISYNKLKQIPSEIGELRELRVLNLSYNEIDRIPDEIGNLTELRELNLMGNKISEVPKTFKNLTKLSRLNLDDNPIGKPPLEISSQGLKAVTNYYLNIANFVKLNEAKVLIVGQGAVGKTFLLNRLVYDRLPVEGTTQGIDILKWIVSGKEDSRIRINAWDFGGQEIYHSTHQFFLTKRSVYVLVWEARKDEDTIYFDYWLNIVNVLSGGSPVILVMNKADERVKEIDEQSLITQFPNIKKFVSVSAISGQGVKELKETISQLVCGLPHIEDKLPEIWSKVREELERLPDNYIDVKTYREICYKHGLNLEVSKQLSKYLHDLGVFLHFQESPVLKSIIFLKPEWVTNSVYDILDLQEVVKSFGRFNLDLLERKVNNFDEENVVYFIELMKKFELCYEISDGEYIVPELLSPNARNIDFAFERAISIEFKYDFMPAGIIARIAFRMRDFLDLDQTWKYGLVVKFSENTFGLVKSNPYTRTITFYCVGDEKASLLEVLKVHLEKINKSLNNPSHKVLVACVCDECQNSDRKYMFDYEYLKRAKFKKRISVTCEHSVEDVNLIKLIGPYEIKFHNDDSESFGISHETLFMDLVKITQMYQNRKLTTYLEDNINDIFVDHLRSKDYIVLDQTRGGVSSTGMESGELDLLVKNENHFPLSVIEGLRLQSIGYGNTSVIKHLEKLVLNYDSFGLPRNFLLIYCELDNFSEAWNNYQSYIDNLKKHRHYNIDMEFVESSCPKQLNSYSNIKVLISYHNVSQGEAYKEIFHVFINMK